MRAVSTDAGKIAAEDLLRQASALGIPWERILSEEIRAERTLQLSLSDVNEDWPLWPAFWILPLSLLDSWRLRDRIHRLAWRASRDGCESVPERENRMLDRRRAMGARSRPLGLAGTLPGRCDAPRPRRRVRAASGPKRVRAFRRLRRFITSSRPPRARNAESELSAPGSGS